MAQPTLAQLNSYEGRIYTQAIRIFRQTKDLARQEHHNYGFLDRVLNVIFDDTFVINPQAKRPENRPPQNTRILDFIVLNIGINGVQMEDHLWMEVKRDNKPRQEVRHQLHNALTLSCPPNFAKFGSTSCGNRYWFWECYGPGQNVIVPGAGPPGNANPQPPGFVLMMPGHPGDGRPGTCDETPQYIDDHGLDITDDTDKISILRLFHYIAYMAAPLGRAGGE